MTKGKPTYTTVHWKALSDPDKFRDADRIEEAQKIPLTEAQRNLVEHIEAGQIPLTESQRTLIEEENKDLKENQLDKQHDLSIFDIVKKYPDLSYRQAEKLKETQTLKKETGACITAGIKRDKTALEVQKMNKDKK